MEVDDNPRMQKLFAYFESVQGSTFVENHWWDPVWWELYTMGTRDTSPS